jgi:hypothetical protein
MATGEPATPPCTIDNELQSERHEGPPVTKFGLHLHSADLGLGACKMRHKQRGEVMLSDNLQVCFLSVAGFRVSCSSVESCHLWSLQR